MIHLDTNHLIGLLVRGSAPAVDVDKWLAADEAMAVSAVAFVIRSRVVPFGQPEAVLAAGLFNRTARRRGSRFDCFIAATAILPNAEVATINQSDFKVFVPHGLKLK